MDNHQNDPKRDTEREALVRSYFFTELIRVGIIYQNTYCGFVTGNNIKTCHVASNNYGTNNWIDATRNTIQKHIQTKILCGRNIDDFTLIICNVEEVPCVEEVQEDNNTEFEIQYYVRAREEYD